jgi:formate hydrogenlyase transcriptional activator
MAREEVVALMQISSALDAAPQLEERYRTLLEINNAIATSLRRDELLHAICEALRRVLPFDRAALNIYEPETDLLRLLALETSHESQIVVGSTLSRNESASGWVFDHQQPLLRRDLEKEAQYEAERLAMAEGIRSLCIVPLAFHGNRLGTLIVLSKNIGQYTEADADFLHDVANQIALAIENMKAYEEIAALNGQVRLILDSAAEGIFGCESDGTCIFCNKAAADLLGYDDSAELLGKNMHATEHHSRPDGSPYPLEECPIYRGFLENKGVHRDDEVFWRKDGTSFPVEYWSHPIIRDGETLGAVVTFVDITERRRAYEQIQALKAKLEAENVYLQEEIRSEHNFEEIVGSSAALLNVLQKVEMVAPTDATVLLSGETGTGKELIARAIHARSSRKARAMVSVNCGAIPSSLVESELFGHVKGAFTGALERATGRFELADGSTLFLDEVGELPLDTQVKLLRALQEREFQPVGSSRTVRVDVRIIAASNRDLEQAVRTGVFRADLFYRLNVVPMRVPPLRERQSDIPQLAMFFLDRCCKRLGKKITAVSEETMELFVRYDWPGNIRELQNIIERGVVLSPGPVFALDRDVLRMPTAASASNVVEDHDVPASTPATGAALSEQGEEPPLRLADAERQHILAVLKRTGWVIDGPKGAAKILDLHPNTLRGRVKRLGIDRIRH